MTFDSLPVGALLLDQATGATYRKIAETDPDEEWGQPHRDWRVNETTPFGWGSVGTLTTGEWEDLRANYTSGQIALIWTGAGR